MKPLRIAIVVGEASGDILGAGLMDAILAQRPDAIFEGIGGPRMLARGFTSFFPQDRLAVMGLVEPLKRLPELLRIRKTIVKRFSTDHPDVFIGIDSPDFNLTIEEKLRAQGVTTVHYVSPSVWAWRQKRVFKIARAVDLMLTFLPFEADFYVKHDVPVRFVGHTLADDIPLEPEQEQAKATLKLNTNTRYVALMPGSRSGEVKLLGPEIWQAARLCVTQYPDVAFLVPAANASRRQQIEEQLCEFEDLPITLVDGQSHEVMAASELVVMASGTTTLEAMLLKRPMVVCYKFTSLSFAIFKRLVKTKYFSLPNLLADEALVPELLQDQATPQPIAEQMMSYLADSGKASALKGRFTELHQLIKCNASEQAAQAVLTLIEKKKI